MESVLEMAEEDLDPLYNEEVDDPLGVKTLALSYDYLMYKISERIESISVQTECHVRTLKEESEKEIMDVNTSIQDLKRLIKECEVLANEFAKIQEISLIVRGFKTRIRELESFYKVRS